MNNILKISALLSIFLAISINSASGQQAKMDSIINNITQSRIEGKTIKNDKTISKNPLLSIDTIVLLKTQSSEIIRVIQHFNNFKLSETKVSQEQNCQCLDTTRKVRTNPDYIKLYGLILDSLFEYTRRNGIDTLGQRHYKYLQDILLDTIFPKEKYYLPKNIIAGLALINTKALIPDSIVNSSLYGIQDYGALVEMYEVMDRYILFRQGQNIFDQGLIQNLALINQQMEFISQNEFAEYRYTETSRQILKGINLYHDNDFFSGFLIPRSNKDMNYTGGLRLELTTDLLKLRLLNNFVLNEKWLNFLRKIYVVNFFANEIHRLKVDDLSYQSLFYGLEVYTPYLRFNPSGNPITMDGTLIPLGQKLARDTSYMNDRPYASFVHIGRAKYRINEMGTIRTKGEFSVGIIGGSFGKTFQSALHRDLTIASPKPLGWDKQIVNGGRLALNFYESMDILLLSKENDVFRNRENHSNSEKCRKNWPKGANLFSTLEGRFGQQMTHVGFGVGFSNLSFKDRSGTQLAKAKNGKQFGWIYSFEAKYRYMIHNSMLEGFGWLKTREYDINGTPGERLSVYTLPKNVINRNLLFGDFFIGIRTFKTMLFLNIVVNNREFYTEKQAKARYDSKETSILYRKDQLFNTQPWYFFGRLGFNFML